MPSITWNSDFYYYSGYSTYNCNPKYHFVKIDINGNPIVEKLNSEPKEPELEIMR